MADLLNKRITRGKRKRSIIERESWKIEFFFFLFSKNEMESLFFLIKIRRYKNLESKKENGKKLEGFRRKLKNINPRG